MTPNCMGKQQHRIFQRQSLLFKPTWLHKILSVCVCVHKTWHIIFFTLQCTLENISRPVVELPHLFLAGFTVFHSTGPDHLPLIVKSQSPPNLVLPQILIPKLSSNKLTWVDMRILISLVISLSFMEYASEVWIYYIAGFSSVSARNGSIYHTWVVLLY